MKKLIMIALTALSLKASAQDHIYMASTLSQHVETNFLMSIEDDKIVFDDGDDGLWTYEILKMQNVFLSPEEKIILTFYKLEESVIVVVHKRKGQNLAIYQVLEYGVTYQLHSHSCKNSQSREVERIVRDYSVELMSEKQ